MTRMRILMISCGIIFIIAVVLMAACTSPAETPVKKGPKTHPSGTGTPVSAFSRSTSTIASTTFAGSGTVTASVVPLLARPTDHTITVNVLPAENMEVSVGYRTITSSSFQTTTPVAAAAGVPVNISITGLEQDTSYNYQVCWRGTGDAADRCSPEYTFHTGRSSGSSFVFDVQADSHLDEKTSGALYNRTLANILADTPDFLIDLGDTSMSEKLASKTPDNIRAQYLRQRSYFGSIGHSVPLFLVLGNHDGEAGYAPGGKDNSLALLSLQFRKMYFPNPESDGFYTGNTENDAAFGLRQDYYTWEWGDALFIVLDPYWYTTTRPGGKNDGWGWTLGKNQYDWLKETLAEKNTKYTFVFSHQLVGGDPQGRGGVEFASLYEWGGKNSDGNPGFDQHRPGWEKPIHQLLVENNVTAFFHGHDHIFAKQELDGITYQEVPQPATPGSPNPGAEYGYVSGTVLPSPGYLRISVTPESARVEYIGSAVEGTTRSTGTNGAVIYSYILKPRTDVSGG